MNITIKEVPGELHEKLRKVADQSGRSLNKQILYTLEQSVTPRKRNRTELLNRIKARRDQMKVWLDDESLKKAITEGRQ